MVTARGDRDWIATIDWDGIETRAGGFLEVDAAGCVEGSVGTANGSITIEIEVEVGFKGQSIAGVGIEPALSTDARPVVIEVPGVKAIGGSVLPKNGVYTINFCSSEGFPSVINAFIDLVTARGDRDWIATIDWDGEETFGGVF